MDSRRSFIKKSILLSAALGMPESIKKALAIDPAPGSTYLDAEHVVILMQENRSFDHCYGTLQGVRGFNDPRAISLPDKNLVWLQTNSEGQTYAPFRLDIKDTKSVWMGALPHARGSQVDASNFGKHDKWLDAKKSNNPKYADIPLTLGYYTRKDLPFNYAMADAFTICDQHFCSAMTSTYPNRLFLWSGAIREQQSAAVKAHIRNEDLSFGKSQWKTFPERLEENGISWRVYQNDLSCGGGYKGEERSWLANFGCNQLEFFEAYNVKFSSRFIKNLKKQEELLPTEISALKEKASALSSESPAFKKIQNDLQKKQTVLNNVKKGLLKWSQENYNNLPQKEKNLYENAFTTNIKDTNHNQFTTLNYKDEKREHKITVPQGDILYQFRKDVDEGTLPTVSWLVSPQNFSEHPSAPMYGNWYVSEILDILTKNPEVWKKTIFILTYDENDGFFDHVPPFTAPEPDKPDTGKCSPGIDTGIEFIKREDELKHGVSEKQARQGPVGLGFRVPLIIASPWSRGGQVCSQVFDHTSSLQFLEKFLSKKLGKTIKETNISQWRRTVCGDLTSVFNPYNETSVKLPFLEKNQFIESIHKAQFKEDPSGFKPLSQEEIQQINKDPRSSSLMPHQEKGMKPSCALPYQLYAEGALSADKKQFELILKAKNEVFGAQSAGSPFNVYMPGKYFEPDGSFEVAKNSSYAVSAGDSITDSWPLKQFENASYHTRVYGPNGFYREFIGDARDPLLKINLEYQRENSSVSNLTGNVVLEIESDNKSYDLQIINHGYGGENIEKKVGNRGSGSNKELIVLDLAKSFGWYDFSVKIAGSGEFERRYAGRVETGRKGYSDPVMGQVFIK